MMTYEKAIECMKDFVKRNEHMASPEVEEAMMIIKDEATRMIPQTPIPKTRCNVCSFCRRSVPKYDPEYRFCSYCGQAIKGD